MEVVKMTVSDANGNTSTSAGKIITVDKEPLKFYAVQPSNTGTEIKVSQITIAMPLGGENTGLFRYPKVGEVVLVASDTSGGYLIAYVPNTKTQSFAVEKDVSHEYLQDMAENEGKVFRYQSDWDKDEDRLSKKQFSEVGFYMEKTQWKKDPTDEKSTVATVDTLKLQSTGDIHQSADNYHQIKAKRIEILSDLEAIDQKDIAVDQDDENKGKKLPLGDAFGDDSFLHPGDVHIRAGNRVVIKAGDEIRLQVGRSSISIKDTGITIASNKMHSNNPQTFNTSLSLTPRDGISMFGQNVNIRAGRKFSLTDTGGGEISSSVGVVKGYGRDIAFSTTAGVGNLLFTLKQSLEYAVNTASLAESLKGVDAKKGLEIAIMVQDFVDAVADALTLIFARMGLDEYSSWMKNKQNVGAQTTTPPQPPNPPNPPDSPPDDTHDPHDPPPTNTTNPDPPPPNPTNPTDSDLQPTNPTNPPEGT